MAKYGTFTYGQTVYGTGALTPIDPAAFTVEPHKLVRQATVLPRLYLADKHNQLFDDLSDDVLTGEVVLDLDFDVSKWVFTVELKRPRQIRPLIDYAAPHLKIVYEDGTITEEQVGLFSLLPSSYDHAPSMSRATLDGRDLCWVLAAHQSTGPVTMASGANIVNDALDDLWVNGGLSRGLIAPSSKTADKAYTWPPGTSTLERVNDRLAMIGYYTLVFDRQGRFFSYPYRDLATVEPDVYYTDASGWVVPNVAEEPDFSVLANRVVVVGTDPSQEPIYAVRENVDPTSPVAPINLGGLVLGRREEGAEIQDQAAADALADELIRNGASYYRRLTLQTRPDPTRQPREVYELSLTNPDGTVADGKWWCSGWTLPLTADDPIMTHELNRTQAFSAEATP